MSLADRIIAISERRSPDFIVGEPENPYLRRWWLIPRNPIFNVYLHQFLRSDDDRALHDHPWPYVSILLRGAYIEITPKGWFGRAPGSVVARTPRARHRVVLLSDTSLEQIRTTQPDFPSDCWTLFITGPRVRQWGFWCPQGFVPWQKFTSPAAKGEIGKGCDQ